MKIKLSDQFTKLSRGYFTCIVCKVTFDSVVGENLDWGGGHDLCGEDGMYLSGSRRGQRGVKMFRGS